MCLPPASCSVTRAAGPWRLQSPSRASHYPTSLPGRRRGRRWRRNGDREVLLNSRGNQCHWTGRHQNVRRPTGPGATFTTCEAGAAEKFIPNPRTNPLNHLFRPRVTLNGKHPVKLLEMSVRAPNGSVSGGRGEERRDDNSSDGFTRPPRQSERGAWKSDQPAAVRCACGDLDTPPPATGKRCT